MEKDDIEFRENKVLKSPSMEEWDKKQEFNKKRKERMESNSKFVGKIFFFFFILFLYGYFLNVFKLLSDEISQFTTMIVMRIIGVAVPPVGFFIGYI